MLALSIVVNVSVGTIMMTTVLPTTVIYLALEMRIRFVEEAGLCLSTEQVSKL